MTAKFDVRNFAGLAQVSEPRLQDRNFAQAIQDAKVWNGSLRNWPCPTVRCAPGGQIRTIAPLPGCPCLTSDDRLHYAWDCQSVMAYTDGTGLRLTESLCGEPVCAGMFGCPGGPPEVAATAAPASQTSFGRQKQFTYDDVSPVCTDYRVGDAPPTGSPNPDPPTVKRDDDLDFSCEDCDFPETTTAGPTPCDDGRTQRFAYVYTRNYTVGGMVYESAPTPASEEIDVCTGATVSGMVPGGACFSHFNVYRIMSGIKLGEETQTPVNNAVVYVGSTMSTMFTDNLNALQTAPAPALLLEFGEPPVALHSLGKTESGVYVGLVGNELWYTFPGRVNTWRPTRRRTIDPAWGNALTLAVHKDDVYVLTDNRPVWYQVGLSESGPILTRNTYMESLPLWAIGSVAVSKVGVHYASGHGLVALLRGDSRVIGSSAWLGDQWRRADPASAVGAVQGSAYFLSTSVDSFLFEFDDGLFTDNPRTELTGLNFGGVAVGATAAAADGQKLLWAQDGTVYEWDRAAYPARSHTDLSPLGCSKPCCKFFYRSAFEDENRSVTYTWAEVHFGREYAAPEVELRIYRIRCGCPELVCRRVVRSCKPFAIRGCRRDEDWYFELEGCGEVLSVTFATSASALRGDSGAK